MLANKSALRPDTETPHYSVFVELKMRTKSGQDKKNVMLLLRSLHYTVRIYCRKKGLLNEILQQKKHPVTTV